MQENRSFDHYFGTLKGVRGFADRFTIPLPNGRRVWEQLRSNGQVLTPFHLDGTANNAQRADGTPHTWDDSQLAWDNGRMANWPTHKTDISMGYFKEKEIPYQFALANAFTICDAYHCSMHTGTDANRSFHLTGTNGATPTKRSFVNNEWDWIDGNPATADRGYTWKTYAERLEEAGVSWICYQNMPDEWGDNMLGAFRSFRKANIASGYPVSSGESRINRMPIRVKNYRIKPMMRLLIIPKIHSIKALQIRYRAINQKSISTLLKEIFVKGSYLKFLD